MGALMHGITVLIRGRSLPQHARTLYSIALARSMLKLLLIDALLYTRISRDRRRGCVVMISKGGGEKRGAVPG
eukprot:COSAG05_NODE_3699_length_1894_cov_398.942714_2_plen_73_part_00